MALLPVSVNEATGNIWTGNIPNGLFSHYLSDALLARQQSMEKAQKQFSICDPLSVIPALQSQ